MPTLKVFIPGFGEPYWNEKLLILNSNINKILEYNWDKVDITVCKYTPKHVRSLESLNVMIKPDTNPDVKLTVIESTGIVGDFIKRYANPDEDKIYDYYLFLLDDIQLQPDINWNTLIEIKNKNNIDIASPTLTRDSEYIYDYMRCGNYSNANIALKTSCLEFFCYFMDHKSYKTWYSFIDENNPWMWGLDLLIHKHMNLNVALINNMTMHHYYKHTSYGSRPDHNPAEDCNKFIEKYNETYQSLAEQKAVLEVYEY